MPVNKEHIFDTGIYFVTFTNYKWLPLFQITNGYEFVYKWFDSLKERGNSVLGFVIMPNHVHLLIGYKKAEKSINTIVDRIKEIGNAALLKTRSEGVTPSDWRKGKLHEVFNDSFDIKLCRTYKFVAQKLDYIHSNPVSKKWSLAADQALYEHSSARFYATGTQGRYAVAHANDWIFENWRDETSSEGKSAIEP